MQEIKRRMEEDLENERRLKSEFENKLVRLKEDNIKKDAAFQEMSYKINDLIDENKRLVQDNRGMQEQLRLINNEFSQKARSIEDMRQNLLKQGQQQEDKFRLECERLQHEND